MNLMDGENKFQIILYLIIVVGGILANAYRSISKKKEEERKRREHITVDFPEIDNETKYEPQVEVSYDFEVEPELTLSEQKLVIENQETQFPKEEVTLLAQTETEILSGKSDDSENLLSAEISDNNWAQTSDEENSEAFDLKKAIIYSEIVNAKYI